MKKELCSFRDIVNIPIGHTYTSSQQKARLVWTILFGLVTGDLNPIHINPFTAVNYKSKLGGLARHGISTLAQAESHIFKIFSFSEPTEILSKGYQSIRYLAPIRIGDKLVYTYGLKTSDIKTKHAECVWEITVCNQNGAEVIKASWIILYYAIEENIVVDYVSPFGPLGIIFGGMSRIEGTPKDILNARIAGFIMGLSLLLVILYSYYGSP